MRIILEYFQHVSHMFPGCVLEMFLGFSKMFLAVHQHSFRYSEKNQTSLNQFIHDLKKQKLEHELIWKKIDKGKPFSPVTNKCDLCTKEKFHILLQSNPEQLNKRSEIFSHCMHKRSSLLVPREKKKKRTPG